ncbi:GIY-YIG nuclease family protein, partial [Candidatus Berkelbacteria bacterium]|nr:GIY-YIG nuclease family protein [Candidatus Berkelbacteria bacterium]
MFYTYVLQSEKNKRNYYGSTDNLDRRLAEHNRGHTPATRFIRPLKVVYFETFKTLSESRKRELFFKSGQGREFIKQQLGR